MNETNEGNFALEVLFKAIFYIPIDKNVCTNFYSKYVLVGSLFLISTLLVLTYLHDVSYCQVVKVWLSILYIFPSASCCRFQRAIKEINKVLQAQSNGPWPATKISALDKSISDICRSLEANVCFLFNLYSSHVFYRKLFLYTRYCLYFLFVFFVCNFCLYLLEVFLERDVNIWWDTVFLQHLCHTILRKRLVW